MFSRAEHVDRVEEAEDSLAPLHKIDFEFLAPEPLARRLEAIAANLHVATMFIAARSDFSGGKVWGGEKRERLGSGGLKQKPPLQWAAA